MNTPRLAWEGINDGDGVFHVARHDERVSSVPAHRHDFAELFWVEWGEATHHSDTMSHWIGRGDVVLVAPHDRHRFTGPSGDFSMINLAFPQQELSRLRERYFSAGGFPWDTPAPRLLRMTPSTLARAGALSVTGADRFQLDRILIDVLASVSPERPRPELPSWLDLAVACWRRDPAAMERGVTGLAEIAGRSRGHVSRSIREASSRSATAYLNDVRLDEAAARLRESDASILTVATEVGIFSLSHFYALFKTRFGTTPARYRRVHQ